MNGEALRAYTREVLSFALGHGPETAPRPDQTPDPGAQARAEALARRLAESLARSGRQGMILLGLGSGRVALALDRLLPESCPLLVCETDPNLARRVLAEPWAAPLSPPPGAPSRLALAADSSAWALFLLPHLHGPDPEHALVLENPELSPEAKKPLAPLRRLLARTRSEPLARPGQDLPASGPGLTFAAILRPDEPGLADFLASIPPLAREAVLVWDAPAAPRDLPPAGGLAPERVRCLARPLDQPPGRDFAAQRNLMLSACGQDWVLTLDGDERLCPTLSAQLPALISRTDVSGYLFQRRTLYPDPGRCKAGHGLWPDLQLRLFRRLPGLAYERPVHEVLAGLAPPLGLPLAGSILHFNSLDRPEGLVRDKLALFDAASGGGIRHALSAEYPSLPLSLLDPDRGGERLLILDQGP